MKKAFILWGVVVGTFLLFVIVGFIKQSGAYEIVEFRQGMTLKPGQRTTTTIEGPYAIQIDGETVLRSGL